MKREKRIEKIFGLAKNSSCNILNEYQTYNQAIITSIFVSIILIFLAIIKEKSE